MDCHNDSPSGIVGTRLKSATVSMSVNAETGSLFAAYSLRSSAEAGGSSESRTFLGSSHYEEKQGVELGEKIVQLKLTRVSTDESGGDIEARYGYPCPRTYGGKVMSMIEDPTRQRLFIGGDDGVSLFSTNGSLIPGIPGLPGSSVCDDPGGPQPTRLTLNW